MSLVPSLLQAIVHVDGEALVMHAGDKPYVVSPTGQVELATRGLALDAVNGIVSQLLPMEMQQALDEFGAVQHELAPLAEFPGEHFTIVAARGGDDLWVEIRRRRIPDDDRIPDDFFAPPEVVAAAQPYPVYASAASPSLVGSVDHLSDALDLGPDLDQPPAPPEPEPVPVIEMPRREEIGEEIPIELIAEPEPEPVMELEPELEPEYVPLPAPPMLAESQATIERRIEEAVIPVEIRAAALGFSEVERLPRIPVEEPAVAEIAAPVEEPLFISVKLPEPPPVVASPAVAQVEPRIEQVEPTIEPVLVEPSPRLIAPPPPVATPVQPPALVEPPVVSAVEPPAPRFEAPIPVEPPPVPVMPPLVTFEPQKPAFAAPPTRPVAPPPEPVAPPPPPPPPAVVLPLARNPIRAEQPPPVADPTMSGLDRLLRLSAARGASTLYLSSESRPSVRVDGELQMLDGEPVLTARDVESLLLTLMPERNHEALRTGAATEWILDIEDVGRVRCMSFRDHRGPGGVFRLMPTRSVSVDQLGLSRAMQGLAMESEGLVLVAGPRSSGKRTLISAFVDLINRTRRDHVVTIEREINIVHERGLSFISQREVRGSDDDLLAAARAALREDPDVLVIEDLRSADLMNVALEASASGHLVVGGFAAHTATAAVDRIIDLYAPDRRRQVQLALAASLRGVVLQVLLKKTGGGRVAARELLLNTPAVSSVIADGKTSQLPMAIEGGRRYGMMPLNDALVGLVQQGMVDGRDAYRHASDRQDLVAALKHQGVDTSFAERLA